MSESMLVTDLCGLAKIETLDDVVGHFFNQMVECLIEDMAFFELEEVPVGTPQNGQFTKDFKELDQVDLSTGQIMAVNGSKVTLTTRTSDVKKSTIEKNKLSSLKLEPIKEERLDHLSSKIPSTTSSKNFFVEDESQVKIIFTNGNIYEGCISERIMNGFGRYFWTDGTTYEGKFSDGFPTGRGVMTLPDLSRYEGEFNQGLFHGKGFLNIVSSPSFYSGQWRDGLKHGQGWLLHEAGDWYEGGWLHDLKDGFGVRHYKNGCKYRGFWKQGRFHGDGMMIWRNNDFYKGEWKKGAMDGYGEYIWDAFYNNSFTFPLQNIYKGEWQQGKRTGRGVMIFGGDSGARLEGFWDRDFKHGDGYLVCGNGRTVQQELLFLNDKPAVGAESLSNLTQKNLNLSIFTAPELVDVGFYVDEILSKLDNVDEEKLQYLKKREEKSLQHSIVRFLPQLKELYETYAQITIKNELHCSVAMIRLFLWQLYKDVDISKHGVSLVETDLILAKNPKSCLMTQHNPFEVIYFWQFLMSLIGVALSTTSLEEVVDIAGGSVCSIMLQRFFTEVVFAPTQDHSKSSFLNYVDYAPIKAMYSLYKSIGEPHSARTFLQRTCTKRNEVPQLSCLYELRRRAREPKVGVNLTPISDHIIFKGQTVDVLSDQCTHNWHDISCFWPLCSHNVLKCLAKVCPLIAVDGVVANIDYPMSFLEFYETVIVCIFKLLELELCREKKILMQSIELEKVSRSLSESKRGSISKKGSITPGSLQLEKKSSKNKGKKTKVVSK